MAINWLMLSLVSTFQTMLSTGILGLPFVLPFIATDLNLNLVQIGLLGSSINFGMMVSYPVIGKAVDVYGEKWAMLVGGLIAFTGISFASYWISNFYMCYFLFFITGLGLAVGNPGGSKAVMIWFPPDSRGFPMGISQMSKSLGGVIVTVALPLLGLVGTNWHLALRMIAAAIMVSTIMLVFYHSQANMPWADNKKRNLEKTIPSVYLIMKNKRLLTVVTWAIILAGGQYIIITYLLFYLKFVTGKPVETLGIYLLIFYLTGTFGRIFWGKISDRFFTGRSNITLMIISGVSILAILSLLFVNGTNMVLIISSLMLGLSLNAWHGIHSLVVTEIVGTANAGFGVGLSSSLIQIGVLVWQPLFGLIVEGSSFIIAFLLTSLLISVAAMLIWVYVKPMGSELLQAMQ